MINVGDIVWVSNNDELYEEECGPREHSTFFGLVVALFEHAGEAVFVVDFGGNEAWAYNEHELSLASELKDLTLEEFSNHFGLAVNGTYIV